MRETLLIVDDSEADRILLREMLRRDYNLIEACDGGEALNILFSRKYDVSCVLLDIFMPVLSGFEMLAIISSTPALSDIPIVVITSSNDRSDAVKALDLGAADFIIKPYNVQIVRSRVRNIINKRNIDKVRVENLVLKRQNLAQIQLQAILNNIVGGVALVEFADTPKPIYLNPGFFKYFEYDSRGSGRFDFFYRVHPDDIDFVKSAAYNAIRSGLPLSLQCRINVRREVRWINIQGVRIDYEDSIYPVAVVIVSDISELKEIEANFQSTSLELSTILDNIPGGVAIFELAGNRILSLYNNEALLAFSGYTDEEYKKVAADTVEFFIYNEDRPYVFESVKKCLESTSDSLSLTFRVKHQTEGFRWANLRAVKIGTKHGNAVFYCLFIDVTREKKIEEKQKAAMAELEYRANHDVLTGICNRVAFCAKTAQMFRDCPDIRFMLVRFNIERFKVFNDIFGSEMGDELLKGIGNTFRNMLRGVGTYGRLEADHFVVCFPRNKITVNELMTGINNYVDSLSLHCKLTFSLGMYDVDDISVPVERMCDRANLALQTVKGNYQKHYAMYDANLRSALIEEQNIISELSDALKTHQFVVYLQPIFSMSNNIPVSAEALVRWIHPVKGIVPPDLFIPLFERNGFIAELDCYVWEDVCRYQRSRIDAELPDIPISVNLSRFSIYTSALFESLTSIAEKYNVPSKLLKIEITESAYTNNPKQLLGTMKKLQNYGFEVFMDDFGSGYSSLNMLKDVSVDILKIDMCFLGGFETSNRAGNILTSVVRMAKWLKTPVIAEGVETKLQAEFLQSIGCDRIQGYYFSHPLPMKDFEEFVKTKLETADAPVIFAPASVDFDIFFNSTHLLSRIINSIIGGIGIYEYVSGKIEVLRVNDGYYDLMGYDPQSFYEDSSDVIELVHPDDRDLLLSACEESSNGKNTDPFVVRRRRKDGVYIYLNVNVRLLGKNDASSLICLAVNDITQHIEDEQKFEKQNELIWSILGDAL